MHLVDPETFQIFCLKLLQQPVVSSLAGHHPVVEFKRQIFSRKRLVEAFFARPLHQHLLRREVGEQFVNIVDCALGGKKLTCADVEKRHSAGVFSEMHRTEEVVLAVVEHISVDGYSRSHQFGDAALHEFFCQFRVFKLLADCNALSRAHQFWQICVERMVGKPGKFDVLSWAVGTFCERYAQYFRSRDGIG